MMRAIDDTTSTCGSCAYFDAHAPDIAPRTGNCGWISVPAWVYKNHKPESFNQLMYETDGLTCWLHTKRTTDQTPEGSAK